MKKGTSSVQWLGRPEEHDYPAAQSYLSLIFSESRAKALVLKLRRVPISEFKAKDIFRASGLPSLGVSNSHVKADLQKIRQSERLSPLLLVRGELQGKVTIADGYHRLCAVYSVDENAVIPCKIT